MAIYKIPGQNLTFQIPDQGSFVSPDRGQIFYRQGNRIVGIDVSNLTQANRIQLKNQGIDINKLPTVSDEGIGMIERIPGFSILKTRDPNQINFSKFTAPNPQGEVITRDVSPTNPNAPIITSNIQGNIKTGAPKFGQPGAITPPQDLSQSVSPPRPTVLTPEQQDAYYASQRGSATPLSPQDWLKQSSDIIPSIIQAPDAPQTTTPDFPPPQSDSIQQAYGASMQANINTNRTAIENEYKTQIEDLRKQMEESQKSIDELTTLQAGGVEDVDELMKSFREELENKQREELFINKNFQDNQRLINELETLLTEGNELIRQQKEITGLTAIRNPRIAKTISDVNARAGVIQAVMNARNGQINQAYNMIDRSIDAINADRKDRLTYYNTLLNFYENQKDAEGKKLVLLDRTKRQYINAQIGLLENDLAQSQKNAEYIKRLMINPETASFMAKADVSLNDTPEQINAKMERQADYEASTLSPMEQAKLDTERARAEKLRRDTGKEPKDKVYGTKDLPGDIRNSIIEDLQDKEYAKTSGELTLDDLSRIYPEVNLDALRELYTEFYDFDALTADEIKDTGKKWWQFWK